ncbi:MAG: hypothetical protein PUK59_07085 [Actinomycetaceae bacterium]|nr:hypothetical protein [Actinomycetaceae bacterium]MDY5854949.1 hypothetical protein [Arcanobacterium sp.]
MSALIDVEVQPTYNFAAIVAQNIHARAAAIGYNQIDIARAIGIAQGAVNQRKSALARQTPVAA